MSLCEKPNLVHIKLPPIKKTQPDPRSHHRHPSCICSSLCAHWARLLMSTRQQSCVSVNEFPLKKQQNKKTKKTPAVLPIILHLEQ